MYYTERLLNGADFYSTAIESVYFDQDTATLTVEYVSSPGRWYQYPDATHLHMASFLRAPSKGAWMRKFTQGNTSTVLMRKPVLRGRPSLGKYPPSAAPTPSAPSTVVGRYSVVFTVGDDTEEKTYAPDGAASPEDTLAALSQVGKALGLSFTPKRIVLDLDA